EALARATALDERVPRVTFVVDAPAEGLEIHFDDRRVPRAEWGVALPVDPGHYRVEASAPSRRAWSGSFDAAAGRTTRVAVPALAPAMAGASNPPDVAPNIVPEPIASPPPPPPPSEPEPRGSGGSSKTIGLALAGAGAAGLVIGSIAGIIAIGKKSALDDAC